MPTNRRREIRCRSSGGAERCPVGIWVMIMHRTTVGHAVVLMLLVDPQPVEKRRGPLPVDSWQTMPLGVGATLRLAL